MNPQVLRLLRSMQGGYNPQFAEDEMVFGKGIAETMAGEEAIVGDTALGYSPEQAKAEYFNSSKSNPYEDDTSQTYGIRDMANKIKKPNGIIVERDENGEIVSVRYPDAETAGRKSDDLYKYIMGR